MGARPVERATVPAESWNGIGSRQPEAGCHARCRVSGSAARPSPLHHRRPALRGLIPPSGRWRSLRGGAASRALHPRGRAGLGLSARLRESRSRALSPGYPRLASLRAVAPPPAAHTVSTWGRGLAPCLARRAGHSRAAARPPIASRSGCWLRQPGRPHAQGWFPFRRLADVTRVFRRGVGRSFSGRWSPAGEAREASPWRGAGSLACTKCGAWGVEGLAQVPCNQKPAGC